MSDKPILFSAPMVRALLSGTKTQTRRVIKPLGDKRMSLFNGEWADSFVLDPGNADWRAKDLRYAVGDRLWVKETARIMSWSEDGEVWMTYAADETKSGILYPRDEDYLERLCARVEKAGAETNAAGLYENIPPSVLVKPSIHMLRWASRITLTVTDVRVQRLQDISEEDAKAEGIEASDVVAGNWKAYAMAPRPFSGAAPTVLSHGRGVVTSDPRHAYATLWTAINGPGSWETNPWVAAYTFTVALGNIDQIARAA